MRPLTRHHLLVALAAVIGCAGGESIDPDQGTFGDPSAGPTSSPPATMTSSSGSAGTSTTASSGGPAATSNGMADTTETNAEADTTPETGEATEAGGETETEVGGSSGGPSEQPEDGMYSTCETAAECFGLTLCMTIQDDGGSTIDGYCTITGCVSMNDCEASPGGEAVEGCYEATIDGASQFVCALDCSSGKACPAGMQCYDVTGGSICA